MKKTSSLAAAVVAGVALVGVSATAHAEPVAAHPAVHRLVDHGVGFAVTELEGHAGAVARAIGGRFVAGVGSVSVIDDAGAPVTSIPLGLHTASGQTSTVNAVISDHGHTLTLTRPSTLDPIDDAADTLARKQYNAGVGAAIGGGIGAVLGFFLGGVGALVTIPIGAGIGALIGYSTP